MMMTLWLILRNVCLVLLLVPMLLAHQKPPEVVERFGRFQEHFQATGKYQNPYTEVEASAALTRPDGSTWEIPLYWDGGQTWGLRVSPDLPGAWTYQIRSSDPGLDELRGRFQCQSSRRAGSLSTMPGHPLHFAYQNGTPVWFMGDTAWALFTDNVDEKHDREAAFDYIDARASQGFNVLHSMLLSEAGWGNVGGPPFIDIGGQLLNPDYWKEVDVRLNHLNQKGMIAGLALAWGDKRGVEPFSWKRLGNTEARKRYARYIVARYAAFGVYFIVAGEWHAEIRTTPGATEDSIRQEFAAVGECIQEADPHGRMIAIHPMIEHGSVREFNQAEWMSFGDYQQNYHELHGRTLESRAFNKPVVNSEYGYHLRDSDGDGVPDKENSTTIDTIRHATWDIAMAGGHFVTGFGTTYFGGHRDPGPFNLRAEKNEAWEKQVSLIKRLFSDRQWWKLEPRDDLIRTESGRTGDRKHLGRVAPPERTYWCLASPGQEEYLLYVRGTTLPVVLSVPAPDGLTVRLFDPRTGKTKQLRPGSDLSGLHLTCPDERDWLFVIWRSD